MFALKTSLLALAISVSSHVDALPLKPDLSLSAGFDTIVCPTGQHIWQAYSHGTVPETSPEAVWTYLGNFCDVTWQGFELVSTTGTCNTGGSTRTFSTQGLTLTEKLGFNYGSYSNPLSWEILFAQGFELLHEPIVQEAVVSKVHDLLVVSKSGSDTQISWEVIGCSNNTATASLIFSTVHGGAVNGTIEYFS